MRLSSLCLFLGLYVVSLSLTCPLVWSSLFNLYNLLENPYSRFFVYKKALDLAASGKVAESIIPSFKNIDSFLQEWNIGKIDQRELFRSISNILKDNKRCRIKCQLFFSSISLILSFHNAPFFMTCSMAKDSFSFLTRYLATFSGAGEDAYTMNEAKEEAVQAIIEFVKSPDIFQVRHKCSLSAFKMKVWIFKSLVDTKTNEMVK